MHIMRARCVRSERTHTHTLAHTLCARSIAIAFKFQHESVSRVSLLVRRCKHFPFLNSAYCHTHRCCQAECIVCCWCRENYCLCTICRDLLFAPRSSVVSLFIPRCRLISIFFFDAFFVLWSLVLCDHRTFGDHLKLNRTSVGSQWYGRNDCFSAVPLWYSIFVLFSCAVCCELCSRKKYKCVVFKCW